MQVRTPVGINRPGLNGRELDATVDNEGSDDDDLFELDSNGKRVIPSPLGIPPSGVPAIQKSGSQQTVTKNLRLCFIDKEDKVVRSRPWSKCATMEKLLTQVEAAGIVASFNNEFVLSATLRGVKHLLVKGDADDFGELEKGIGKWQARKGAATLGVMYIRLESEIKGGGD